MDLIHVKLCCRRAVPDVLLIVEGRTKV